MSHRNGLLGAHSSFQAIVERSSTKLAAGTQSASIYLTGRVQTVDQPTSLNKTKLIEDSDNLRAPRTRRFETACHDSVLDEKSRSVGFRAERSVGFRA